LRPYITSTAENCLGKECDDFNDCFVFKARKKASEAELIVVNHHLLLADLSLKETGFGEILPKADAIIFDEAHQLPELASEFFSQSLSSRQISELINDCRTAYLKDINDTPEFLTKLDKLQTNLKKLRLVFGHTDKRIAWNDVLKNKKVLSTLGIFKTSLNELENALDQLSERSKLVENCWQRCGNFIAMLETFVERETDSIIQWVETRGKGFLLHQTPLDISEIFQSRLTEHACQCIYTSATLAVGQDFKHFANRLGLTDIKSKTWSSPFDYLRQALLYLPSEMPEPREPNYISHVINSAIPIIKASQGHTFFLFTSHRALKQAQKLIRDKIDYPVMVQGEAPRTELLKRFRETENSVLLGTQSFWEGVDVKGQALSCVIIDKLPFAPPDDPVFRARSARMEENHQNPFMEYQLPEAIINLRQGIGRLIRDVNDFGVLMICDPRLQSKPYGQRFINSLPEMKMTSNITEVELFFEQRQ
jgi:ATP-dependent DNA helicase DinG